MRIVAVIITERISNDLEVYACNFQCFIRLPSNLVLILS